MQLITTRKKKYFIAANAIPVHEKLDQKNHDGHKQDIRKKIFVRSADIKVSIKNSLMFTTLTATSTIAVQII